MDDGQLDELGLAAFRPTSVPETFNSIPRASGGVAICRSLPPLSLASFQACSVTEVWLQILQPPRTCAHDGKSGGAPRPHVREVVRYATR